MKKLPALLLGITLLSGCATVNTPQAGGDGVTFTVRGNSYDEVWNAVVVAASRSLTIVESNKSSGTLRAEKGVGLATWGEVVGIFVRPTRNGSPKYTVEVESLKRSRLQITGQDWTTTMVAGIQAELDK